MTTSAHGPGPFGALLQQYRLRAGLSQEELAERAGLSRRGISDLERGARRTPYPVTVRRLAEALALAEPDRAELLSAARKPGSSIVARDTVGAEGRVRHNLPMQLTSFIGRVQETADIRRELTKTRLLTLTGSGGVGKTRLALKVGEEELGTYRDGVWWVELAPLLESTLVPQLVASTLNVRENPGESVITTLTQALQPLHQLLILDNCEHVLGASVDLVRGLLLGCPQLRILATSREVLGIGAERVFRVPSLRLPDAGGQQLVQCEAAVLFLERAAAVQPGFTASRQNAAIVADLCRRLDGIPLAIELAASRVKVLALQQISERLTNHFRLLATHDRTRPTRQQTLQGAIDWSYHLLSDLEQHLFDRLSVFAGGWTLEAAEAICGGDGIEVAAILDLLESLLDKSLVLADVGSDGPQRYRLLETLRQYGQERLLNRGENNATRHRLAAFFLQLVEESELPLLTGADRAWISRLVLEQDNLRLALGWLIAQGDAGGSQRLAGAARRFWFFRAT